MINAPTRTIIMIALYFLREYASDFTTAGCDFTEGFVVFFAVGLEDFLTEGFDDGFPVYVPRA